MNITNQKPWYESKTLWYAIITGLVGIFGVLSHDYPTVGWIIYGNSVLTFALRLITNSPIK